MAGIPAEIEARLKPHLAAIARLFRAPRITLIVRGGDGGNAGGDLVLGNDNPTLALGALRARAVAEAEILAGTPEQTRVQFKPGPKVEFDSDSDSLDGVLRPSGNNFKRE